jgi:hypothetical protein
MHPPPPAQGLPQKAAIGTVKRWRKQMLHWTITELMHLTRDELCDLADRITAMLPDLEAGSLERLMALTSLDNIRRVTLRRDLHA